MQNAPYQTHVGGLPVCYACRQYIDGPYITAFNLLWHGHHIGCNLCKQSFADGRSFIEGKDGCAYCQGCYYSAFAPKCAKCSEVITTGQIVKAGIHNFHPEHFVCTTCDVALGSVFFIADDGYPYCEKHFYEAQGLWCYGCDAPIVAGKMVKMGSKSYHTEHFFCNYCKSKLAGREYYEHQGNPFCKSCYLKLYG